LLDALHEFLVDKDVNFVETDFLKDRDWIRRYLAKEMYIHAFDEDASDRIFAETDPEVARAVDAMPKATALVQAARKVIVDRMAGQDKQPAVAQR
jgi:carboxyl-terminal processing protease